MIAGYLHAPTLAHTWAGLSSTRNFDSLDDLSAVRSAWDILEQQQRFASRRVLVASLQLERDRLRPTVIGQEHCMRPGGDFANGCGEAMRTRRIVRHEREKTDLNDRVAVSGGTRSSNRAVLHDTATE